MVSEVDIWNYLVINNWTNRVDLELHEIISDILNVNNYDINEYVMKKLEKHKSTEEEVITESIKEGE